MKIICIGRNYVEHARELKNPLPDEPVFFLKPDTALLIRNRPFFYPDFSSEIHYEVEMVVKMAKNGRHIEERFSSGYYAELGLGIDFTARDIQRRCKEKGLPWEPAKAFDHSAAVSDFIPFSDLKDPENIRFTLSLNGERVQAGESRLMIFGIDRLISYVSQFITLRMGDLLFTGTPAGVGPVKPGDRLEGFIGDRKMLDFRIR